MVRAILPRGHSDRIRQPARPRPCHSALDQMGRLAFCRLRVHHSLRTDDQRLPVRGAGACHPRRLDARRGPRRFVLWPRQAGLVPLSLPRQRRVRTAVEARAAPLRGRCRRLARIAADAQAAPCSDQLCPARTNPHHARGKRVPHVRTL
jgi:hypothetical protein